MAGVVIESSVLDPRVRREAQDLLRRGRRLLERGERWGKGGGGAALAGDGTLRTAVTTMEAAMAASQGAAIRAALPALDAAVEESTIRGDKSVFREYAESIGFAVLIALVLRAFVIEAFKIPSSSMIPTLEIGDHIFVNKFIYGVRVPWTRTKVIPVSSPARGDVMVFINPCEPEKDFIKRVVALGGDTVEVRCNILYVNGKPAPATLLETSDTCSYRDEDQGHWRTKSCTRYRETLGGVSYDTLHSAGRPSQPPGQGDHDFPLLGSDRPPWCARPETAQPELPALGELVRTLPKGVRPATPCSPQTHYVVPKNHVFAMGDNRANSSDSRVFGSIPVDNIKGEAMFIWWAGASPDRWKRMGKLVE